ncbi:unnamed protein product [Protopolystoma xenopodis]|uniref:Ubiquitin carboxyl-terminal hydrolase n=1 Tax=Protopolystoma xenopodis TaxID=117903 RepID=A0A3S4ZPN7_9PLAT|nr:unnamed protein product [Protopolystoma xenopodis]
MYWSHGRNCLTNAIFLRRFFMHMCFMPSFLISFPIGNDLSPFLIHVTDLGLLNEDRVVWEALNDVDGDTQFVDANFSLFAPPTTASGGGGSSLLYGGTGLKPTPVSIYSNSGSSSTAADTQTSSISEENPMNILTQFPPPTALITSTASNNVISPPSLSFSRPACSTLDYNVILSSNAGPNATPVCAVTNAVAFSPSTTTITTKTTSTTATLPLLPSSSHSFTSASTSASNINDVVQDSSLPIVSPHSRDEKLSGKEGDSIDRLVEKIETTLPSKEKGLEKDILSEMTAPSTVESHSSSSETLHGQRSIPSSLTKSLAETRKIGAEGPELAARGTVFSTGIDKFQCAGSMLTDTTSVSTCLEQENQEKQGKQLLSDYELAVALQREEDEAATVLAHRRSTMQQEGLKLPQSRSDKSNHSLMLPSQTSPSPALSSAPEADTCAGHAMSDRELALLLQEDEFELADAESAAAAGSSSVASGEMTVL